jgi:hypothetical protein
MTPEDIRLQLAQVGREQSKAHDAIEKLELEAERAELAAQSAIDRVFLTAEGSIPEKQAQAREQSLELRDAAVVARAALNRAKMKAKFLESETMRLMAQLKSIQLEGA